MKKLLLTLITIFMTMKIALGFTEKNVVLFNDSTTNRYKVMSFKLNESAKEVDLKFTSKTGTAISKNFSDVYSFKTYLNSNEPVSLEFRYYSKGSLSKAIQVNIPGGKGYKEILLPFFQDTKEAFNISMVDGLQIKVTSSNTSFELDEISFNYHEPEIIKQGPDNKKLKEALSEEKENYKKRKRKEGSSEFLRRKQEYESR